MTDLRQVFADTLSGSIGYGCLPMPSEIHHLCISMIRNFIFHKIVPEHKGGMLEMSVAHFEKCVQFISSRYSVVLLEDIEQQTKLQRSSKPFATLTFDDGYRDNFINAVPILNKYSSKGSFYVVTDCVEKNVPIWIHLIESLFLQTENNRLSLQYPFLQKQLWITATPEKGNKRKLFFSKLRTWLKHAPVEQKDEVVNYLLENIKDVEVPKQMMTWNDLKELKAAGHYIGAHGHTHDALPFIASDERLKEEFELPKQLIQTHLGHVPESFSYPFGFCNARVKNMATATGYRLGLAAERHQLYVEQKHNPFEIPRIALCNEPWWKTKLRITNTIENIKNLLPYSFKYRDL